VKAYGVLLPLRHLVNKRSELSRSYSSHAPKNDFVFRSAYASGAAPTHPYIPRRPAVNVFQGETLSPPPTSHPNFSSPTTRLLPPPSPLRTHRTRDLGFASTRERFSLFRTRALPWNCSFVSPSLSFSLSFYLPSSVFFSRFRWRATIRDSLCFRN